MGETDWGGNWVLFWWAGPCSVNVQSNFLLMGGASPCQSLVGSLLLSPGSWYAQDLVCAFQESVSPVLCKFWQLYAGINGNFLKEGLCYALVCYIQSPCPCGWPLLTHIFAGDTQTQFCLSFWTVFRDTRKKSWCSQTHRLLFFGLAGNHSPYYQSLYCWEGSRIVNFL